MKIGVFDSGAGGKSVMHAIQKALPDHEVVFVNDVLHVPYGTKSPDEILGYVIPLLDTLIQQGCKVIVIACNTVSTTLIDKLRAQYKVPLIAMEPMIKPAAKLTKSRIIAVCATPTTLASSRYRWLKNNYAHGLTVLEPDCSDWSYMIEHEAVNEQKIFDRIDRVCQVGADVIILGCTHYHWIEDLVNKIAKHRAIVIQPEQAVVGQLKRVLGQLS